MHEITVEEYMAKPLQALLVVSDLHCGSTVGLCPPMCPLLDDGGWILNEIQDDIWDKWSAFRRWADDHLKGVRWGLVVNGDCIEGVHHGCKQIVHADPAPTSGTRSAGTSKAAGVPRGNRPTPPATSAGWA